MKPKTIQFIAKEPTTAYSDYLCEKVFANQAAIKKLMNNYGACNVRIFGSVAQGLAEEGSDIDFIADKTPLCDASLFDRCALLADLEELLGCKVDIVFTNTLKDHVARHIKENEIIWVC